MVKAFNLLRVFKVYREEQIKVSKVFKDHQDLLRAHKAIKVFKVL